MTDLAEIFARDPQDCTREDMVAIVAAFRERRRQFILGNLQAGSIKPSASKKVNEAVAVVGKLNIADLLGTKK